MRQTAVKTMRGILYCWMQEVDKINNFKQNNSPRFALHCRFNLQTGMEIPTPFNHLQMGLVSVDWAMIKFHFTPSCTGGPLHPGAG